MRSSLFKKQEKVPLKVLKYSFFLSTAVSLSTCHVFEIFYLMSHPLRHRNTFGTSADPLECSVMPPCDTTYVPWSTKCWRDALYPNQE